MTEMYGQKFTNSYGDAPNETWTQALASITQKELSAGVRACLLREDTWPPSLPEFLRMCRPPKPNRPVTAMPLPTPVAKPEVVEKFMTDIRRILNLKKIPKSEENT